MFLGCASSSVATCFVYLVGRCLFVVGWFARTSSLGFEFRFLLGGGFGDSFGFVGFVRWVWLWLSEFVLEFVVWCVLFCSGVGFSRCFWRVDVWLVLFC